MGVRKTADFLEKATWTLAVSLLVLCLIASATIPRGGDDSRSLLQDKIDAVDPGQAPVFPNALPDGE